MKGYVSLAIHSYAHLLLAKQKVNHDYRALLIIYSFIPTSVAKKIATFGRELGSSFIMFFFVCLFFVFCFCLPLRSCA